MKTDRPSEFSNHLSRIAVYLTLDIFDFRFNGDSPIRFIHARRPSARNYAAIARRLMRVLIFDTRRRGGIAYFARRGINRRRPGRRWMQKAWLRERGLGNNRIPRHPDDVRVRTFPISRRSRRGRATPYVSSLFHGRRGGHRPDDARKSCRGEFPRLRNRLVHVTRLFCFSFVFPENARCAKSRR